VKKWPVLTSNVIDSQYKIVILTQNQDSDFFQSYCSPEGCHSPWLWKRSPSASFLSTSSGGLIVNTLGTVLFYPFCYLSNILIFISSDSKNIVGSIFWVWEVITIQRKKQLCNEKPGSFVASRIGMKSNESEEKGSGLLKDISVFPESRCIWVLCLSVEFRYKSWFKCIDYHYFGNQENTLSRFLWAIYSWKDRRVDRPKTLNNFECWEYHWINFPEIDLTRCFVTAAPRH